MSLDTVYVVTFAMICPLETLAMQLSNMNVLLYRILVTFHMCHFVKKRKLN